MATESGREAIIRVENFKAAYDGQVILDHINFEVYAGAISCSPTHGKID